MATVFDISLLQSFDVVFAALFVFALVYAILHKTKALGDSLAINAIVAVAISFLVLLSDTIVKMLKFIIPWFAITIIFFVLLLLIFMIFGAEKGDILTRLKADTTISWVIIGIGIVIMVAAFANVLGQKFTEASFQQGAAVNATTGGVASGNFQQNITATLFHPKVLALIVLFVIAIFAVALLTSG